MTAPSAHEALGEMLPAAALEILEEADLHAVLDHTYGCRDCAELLQQYREVVVALGAALPARRLTAARSAAVRARLLARVRADRASLPETSAAPGFISRTPRRPRWVAWGGWVAAAGVAGVLLVHHSIHQPVAFGWLVAGALLLVVAWLGWYAIRQRERVAALRARLSELETTFRSDR